jgi:16S rRNA processing protein RimM
LEVLGGIKAGRISRPYGLRGEINFILLPERAQQIASGTPLFIDLDGQRIPFFIESSELISSDQAIIKLEFIDSIEEAKKVSGRDAYLDPGQPGGSAGGTEKFSKVLGYRVFDLNLGELGTINDYLPAVMNPVWLIDTPQKEIMVPATDEFIHKIDHRKRTIYLDLPGGITDL